jgi:hypothetical protein
MRHLNLAGGVNLSYMSRGARSAQHHHPAGRIAAIAVTVTVVIAGCLAVILAAPHSAAKTAHTTAAAQKVPGTRSGPTAAAAAAQAVPSATSAATPAPTASPTAPAKAKRVFFGTLPPGAKLPSGATCAKLVNASPEGEVKAANKPYNKVKGRHVGAEFFPTAPGSDNPLAQQKLAPRITGNFTGTTIDILRWAACKWGINQNIVFAQAAVESWWQQDTLGDFGSDAAACLPGHKLGQDGKPGLCPQSYGILQNRFPYENGGWPAIAKSTAMNADAAYAIWRACFDGYEVWLNSVPRGSQYHAGDAWGCVGRWFAGRWRTSAALGYIAKVKQYKREKIWLTADFRQLS